MKNSTFGFSLIVFGLVFSGIAIDCYSQSTPNPVERWGQLSVINSQLCSADGKPVQLKGLSLYDTTNYSDFANVSLLKWLRDDWKATVFRAAMYTTLNNKFIGDGVFKNSFAAIQAAIDAGMYVMVDWHIANNDGDPNINKEYAKDFFTQVATQFGSYPNVIYEICNEPNGAAVTWSEKVKPYAMEVISVIRAIDKNNVILVGTPQWSQHPEQAAQDPLPFANVLYVLHYYAGSHNQIAFLSQIDTAKSQGAGTYISEWGVTKDSGQGAIAVERSISWIAELNKRQLSWANWSLATKPEPCSVLKPLASNQGGWRVTELTDSGILIRALMRGEASGPIFADGFDSANFKVGGWIREGASLDRTTGQAGGNSLRFEGKGAMTKNLPVESASDLKLEFWYKSASLGKSDKFNIEWSGDGNNWKVLATMGAGLASPDWKLYSLNLPAAPAGGGSYLMRLRSDFASAKAQFWVDELVVSATRAGIVAQP